MLKFFIATVAVFLFLTSAKCQNQITYFDSVQTILHTHCASCHKPGGLGPFSLTTYEEVAKRGRFISSVISARYMPPWKADYTFQSYKNENILTDSEISTIQIWVESGMPRGTMPKRELETLQVPMRKPDVSLKMNSTYQLSNNGEEDFRFFVIPTGFKSDQFVSSIEFIPGNRQLVHHSRIMVDTSKRMGAINGMSELDPEIKIFQQIPLADEFLYGWVPGNESIFFPPNTAKRISKNSDLVLNIHYSPTSKTEKDQSLINLYFSKDEVFREVQTLTLRENHIQNQPFLIKAETKHTFNIDYTINRDISLISIMPHMHFIGKKFISYAVTPTGEQIPLVRINDWDFNWQTTYQFKKMIHLPAFSRIIVFAVFDNTSSNSANPNSPPIDISYGWNTKDEMLNAVFYYVDYKANDEFLEY